MWGGSHFESIEAGTWGELGCYYYFKILVEAYFMYGMDINNIEEETSVFQEQEEIYNDVQDGFYETLQLYVDYKESYKIYKAALPDPDHAKNDADEHP